MISRHHCRRLATSARTFDDARWQQCWARAPGGRSGVWLTERNGAPPMPEKTTTNLIFSILRARTNRIRCVVLCCVGAVSKCACTNSRISIHLITIVESISSCGGLAWIIITREQIGQSIFIGNQSSRYTIQSTGACCRCASLHLVIGGDARALTFYDGGPLHFQLLPRIFFEHQANSLINFLSMQV